MPHKANYCFITAGELICPTSSFATNIASTLIKITCVTGDIKELTKVWNFYKFVLLLCSYRCTTIQDVFTCGVAIVNYEG